MDKKGVLATFDALTFFMVALIVSVVITTAVLKSREVTDLEQTRQDIDETAYSLSVIIQYSIRSCYYINETGVKIDLEDKTILNLIGLILINKELDRGYNTTNIADTIEKEIDGVLDRDFRLQADSRSNSTLIPDAFVPEGTVITTSLHAPASEDLGGSITLVLSTWD